MYTKKIIIIFFSFFLSTASHSSSMNMIGEKGDPNKVDRVVNIKMYDNYYEPNVVKIKKGETIKFIFENLLSKIKNDLVKLLLNLNLVISNSREDKKDEPIERNSLKKTGRNEKCPCGSGKKFKYCHGNV